MDFFVLYNCRIRNIEAHWSIEEYIFKCSPHLYFASFRLLLQQQLLKAFQTEKERIPTLRGECLKKLFSINDLRACVLYLHPHLSSFRAPTLWFIDLTIATCHIQYKFLSLCQFVSRENGQNTKILQVENGRRRLLEARKALILRASLRKLACGF